MKLKTWLLFVGISLGFSASAQIKFDPKIDVNFLSDTLMHTGDPLKFQILFKGGYDHVQTTATYGHAADTAIAKSWNDFIGFTPDPTGASLGWISINHEEVVSNDKIGDGGGMTVFRVKRDPNTDTLIIMEQTLSDGRKGKFFNVDFANTTGETGMNCGGIVSQVDGRIWTAEEWFRYSNKDIADRDTSDFIIGQGTVNGQSSPAGFAGYNGEQIQKFENFNYMVEIDPREAKAIRKQYNWGRQNFEGGVVMEDNKTVYTGADATPGFFTKFVADAAGDFTSGKTYVYRHIDSNVRMTHWSSQLETYAEISAYDEVNDRIYSTESNNFGVTVFSLKNGSVSKIDYIDLSANGAAPTSVACNNGVLAVALPNATKTDAGTVRFYDKDLKLVKTVTVGALPDMITFTGDGKYVLVANEGEPNDDYTIDPEGSVSVIDLTNGVANATVMNADFNGVTIPADVRIFGRKAESQSELFISEYAEGSSNHKYLEIFNASNQTISLDNYAFPNTSNGATTNGEYEFWNAFPTGATIAPGKTYVIAHGSSDASILAKTDYQFTYLSNGNDGFCLTKGGTWNDANSNSAIDAGEMTGFTILDCVGDWGADPGAGWSVAGVSDATKDHTLVRKAGKKANADWTASAGTNADNSEWIVLDNNTWTDVGIRKMGVFSTPQQDIEPEYIAVSTDNKTAYVTLQENNAIAVVDIATAKVTKILPLGYKDHSLTENSLDASDKDNAIGNEKTYANLKGMYMPDAIAVANIGGKDYLLTANEGDSRDYDGYSEEARVKDLTLDPTAFPNASTIQAEDALGRLKTTTSMGDTDGDGDFDVIYSYGGRSFSIWDTDGNQIFDSKNQLETMLATMFAGNYPADRDDDKGAEPESVTVGVIGSKTFAFIGCERSAGVFVYDITDPAKAHYVTYYNKNGNDRSPEGLIFISRTKSDDGEAYLISTNEVIDDYHGSVSAYRIYGLDGKNWVEINNHDLDKMLNFDSESVNVGATMFNRLEWVTYDTDTKAVYFTETGRDNPGSSWADDYAKGGHHANHTLARAAAQGVSANDKTYVDYYGRVLKYDPATEQVTVHIEGGPDFATSPDSASYPKNHLSNPDGITTMHINGRSYLVICEDLNGTSAGRVPAGITTPTCELYLLDLTIAKPTVNDLVRIAVSPYGAETTGACPTPDGKTLLVNAQHPSTKNPYPYNYSLTYALTGWELEKHILVEELKKKNENFIFYPNPTNGKVVFEKTQDVAVYDAKGTLIQVFEQTNEIDLSAYANGVYYLKNTEGATKKLVLNN
ncbi:MAG: DUF839 domain-containing protein [Bacteroidetes bacterium]|nr:DUF839 domain-containing protein [Bacteroidota bacterium]